MTTNNNTHNLKAPKWYNFVNNHSGAYLISALSIKNYILQLYFISANVRNIRYQTKETVIFNT